MAHQESITLLEFQRQFDSGEKCREHLFDLRWGGGFRYPHCGHTEYYNHFARNLRQCRSCGHQVSAAAGTVMHKIKVPLLKWFWAVFLASHDRRGVPAARLRRELGVSYLTAWLMLRKIRKAMGDRDAAYQLAGLVELDDSYFGGPAKGGKRGRGTEKKAVLAGLSIREPGKPGFMKMEAAEDITHSSLAGFAERNRAEGSVISSDAYSSYMKAFSGGAYQHQPKKFEAQTGNEHLRRLHTIVSNAKRFILGTYHGLGGKHFQAYPDEFCYRMNRRFAASQLFDRLLCACASTAAVTYQMLVSESS